LESAFDEEDAYELSELGQQFVYYAMTDLPLKIEKCPPGVRKTAQIAGLRSSRSRLNLLRSLKNKGLIG